MAAGSSGRRHSSHVKNQSTFSWTLALFFGSAIAFAAVRKLTEGAGAGVTLLAQLGVLALIIVCIVFVVRRQERK